MGSRQKKLNQVHQVPQSFICYEIAFLGGEQTLLILFICVYVSLVFLMFFLTIKLKIFAKVLKLVLKLVLKVVC